MTQCHPTAVVDSRAEIGERVKIGPFVVVEPGVTIGEDCSIEAHAVLRRELGNGVVVRLAHDDGRDSGAVDFARGA